MALAQQVFKNILILSCVLYGHFCALEAAEPPTPKQDVPREVRGTGLPVPRFVSTRSSKINIRIGPGDHYPIEWVVERSRIPLEIISEFDNWRKVKDVSGQVLGWAHKSMLSKQRYIIIKCKDSIPVKSDKDVNAGTIAFVENNVTAKLSKHKNGWAYIQIEGVKGWIQDQFLWGVYPQEDL